MAKPRFAPVKECQYCGYPLKREDPKDTQTCQPCTRMLDQLMKEC